MLVSAGAVRDEDSDFLESSDLSLTLDGLCSLVRECCVLGRGGGKVGVNVSLGAFGFRFS